MVNVDLKKITVDKTKPKQKILEQFASPVKKTDAVKVGDVFVRMEFVVDRSFSDALAEAFTI